MYRDPSLWFSKWNGGFILRNAKQDSYNHDSSDPIEGFVERFISYGGYLGYKIFPKTTFSFNLSIDKKEFALLDSYAIPKNNEYIMAGFNINYRGSQYKFYFKEGTDFSLYPLKPLLMNQTKAPKEKNSTSNFPINGILSKIMLSNWPSTTNRLSQKGLAITLKLGGQKGVRGLPLNGVWASRNTSFSADYQIPLYFSNYGTWTLSTFLEGLPLIG